MVTVKDALFALLSVCDGAKEDDGAGYNGFDAGAARKLAKYIRDDIWTYSMEKRAHEMLRKYRAQLSNFGIDYSKLEFETTVADEMTEEQVEQKRREAWKKRWAAQQPEFIPMLTVEKTDMGTNQLVLKSPFSFKDTATSIPFRHWDAQRKVWTYIPDPMVVAILTPLIESGKIEAGEEVFKVFENLVITPELTYDRPNHRLILRSPVSFKETAKSIPNREWSKELGCWTYPPIAETLRAFEPLIAEGKVEAEESISKLFEKLNWREKLMEVAARIKAGDVPDIPVPLKLPPYEHQKKAFLFGYTLPTAAFFMEQGTGKTLPAIAVAGQRYLDGTVNRLFVIVPKNVLPVWPVEFKKHAAFPFRVVVLGDQSNIKKASILNNWEDTDGLQVVVVNYETAWRLEEPILKWVTDAKIGCMVELDESQKIKDAETKQSKFCHKLGDLVDYKLIMTGTPIISKLGAVDLFSQYRFLNPDIFGTNYYKFRYEHCEMGGYENKVIIGLKDEKNTSDMAYQLAYRVLKKDCMDLPPKVYQVMYSELSGEGLKLYKEALEELKELHKHMREMQKKPMNEEEQKRQKNNILTNMMRRRRIASGFVPKTRDDDGSDGVPTKLISDHKLKLLKEILDEMPREKKLIIYTGFTAEASAIEELVKGTGRNCFVMTGQTKVADRSTYIEKFQNDSNAHVFIIQIKTGNMGITLTAADTIIYYSLDFALGDYLQSQDRIHRAGQDAEKCTYIHLLTRATIDVRIYEALKDKKNAADIIVDKIRLGEWDEGEQTELEDY